MIFPIRHVRYDVESTRKLGVVIRVFFQEDHKVPMETKVTISRKDNGLSSHSIAKVSLSNLEGYKDSRVILGNDYSYSLKVDGFDEVSCGPNILVLCEITRDKIYSKKLRVAG